MRRLRVWLAAVAAIVLVSVALGVSFVPRSVWFLALRMHDAPPETLVLPVDGRRPSDLRSTWHAPRSGGRRHEGVDIFAPHGTRVVASARGVVWKVGTNRLGGRVVTVLGEGPTYYYYAHLSDWAPGLERGQYVEPGDLLGFVGNTGNALTTPPHLHFGVYRVGLVRRCAVDPVPLLLVRK